MIKAAFFDIDGTLVSFNTHIISPSTVEAIHELRQKGVKVFIATGRHPLWINNLADLEIDGYVSLNGGSDGSGGHPVSVGISKKGGFSGLLRDGRCHLDEFQE